MYKEINFDNISDVDTLLDNIFDKINDNDELFHYNHENNVRFTSSENIECEYYRLLKEFDNKCSENNESLNKYVEAFFSNDSGIAYVTFKKEKNIKVTFKFTSESIEMKIFDNEVNIRTFIGINGEYYE